jgi:hypothetical protein
MWIITNPVFMRFLKGNYLIILIIHKNRRGYVYRKLRGLSRGKYTHISHHINIGGVWGKNAILDNCL